MSSVASEPLGSLRLGLVRLARLLRSPALKAVIGAHLVIAAIILVRSHGWLQPFELLIYDALRVAWTGHEPSTRVFLIGGTEDDVADFDWPLRDGELADLLERLASWQPRAIGVDIYRDTPKPPGTERLTEVLTRHKEIVWTFKLQEGAKRAILPPKVLRGTERAVLADLIPDPGNVVRRALLYAGDENYTAMGMELGLRYLAADRIGPAPGSGDDLRLGKAVLSPLDDTRGRRRAAVRRRSPFRHRPQSRRPPLPAPFRDRAHRLDRHHRRRRQRHPVVFAGGGIARSSRAQNLETGSSGYSQAS